MARLQMLLILTSFVSIFSSSCLLAQNSPQDYLKVHNVARAAVGVKPLLWDSKLESEANMFVSKHIVECIKKKGIVVDVEHGRNIASAWRPGYFRGVDAVVLWLSQKPLYNYESNSCIGGDRVTCFAYTQIVSKASTYLGCAKAKCQNKDTLVACFYHPPEYEFKRQ
ncbi:hypothetical protein PIB30_069914 [Stylosanthes scabra]|uniref:SCP domain-containing protein n=1 Tax=Stylosanthes scabra TaxID=79078 RepID=A0ABU6YM83_9FABA|nr:hypothetical protein [Stylosanthes scabra]